MSSTTTTSGGDWWDSIEVYESDYVPDDFTPGRSVEANHNLLGGLRENDFDTSDSAYRLGLLILALVFLVAGVIACCTGPCIFSCLSLSRKERLMERLKFGRQSHIGSNLLMVLACLAAIGASAGAVWGLVKTDSGLTNIEDNTQEVATDLTTVLALPNDTSAALDEVSAAWDNVVEDSSNCSDIIQLALQLSNLVDMDSFVDEVQDEVSDLNEGSLDELADDVQGVSDAVATTEGVRKGIVWPVLSLSILMIIIFILIALGTYEFVSWGVADCDSISCCITPCTVFLAVVIWLSAASAVTLSALSGDFCTDPDTNVEVLIAEESDDATLTELVTYYTTDCNTSNVAVDGIHAAQQIAVPVIQGLLPTLYEIVEECEALEPSIQSVDNALQDMWELLENAANLTSCENLNSLYQSAVYDNLCASLPRGLLGFWVSCVILTVFLLILAVQWSRMLRQRRTDLEAQVVESRQSWLAGKWKSARWSTRLSNALAQSHLSQGGNAPASGSTHPSYNAPPTQRPVETAYPYRESRS